MSFLGSTRMSESLLGDSSPDLVTESSSWRTTLWRSLAEDTPTTNADNDDEEADEPNTVGTALSYIFLFFLIFGLSATVEIKNLQKQLQNKFAIATGVAMQFVIMPILGFLAVLALDRQEGWTQEMGVALLVVTSSPGGSYSNWWCSLFNADLALSVAMTTVSSLLSMAMLPLNLFLYTFLAYGRSEEESVVQALDFGTIFLALGIVLVAILSGLWAGYRNDTRSFHVMANRLGSLSGLLLVLFSVFLSSGADGAENNFWNQEWAFYVGVAFPCLVGIALANVIARSLRLAPPETVAISIECCYQNTGIATSVAIAMYDDKEERAQAVAVPLFYGVVEAVAIAIYCVWAWKVGWTKAPRDEKLCVVLANTYEGMEPEDNDDQAAVVAANGDEAMEEYNDPSMASTRFQDDAVHLGLSNRTNIAEQDEIPEKASPSRVSFWRRLWGGRTHCNETNKPETNKAPFRNDVALAEAMGTIPASPLAAVEQDEAAAPGASSFLSPSSSSKACANTSKAAAHSPARHRTLTMETSASSLASSDRGGGPQTPVPRRDGTSPSSTTTTTTTTPPPATTTTTDVSWAHLNMPNDEHQSPGVLAQAATLASSMEHSNLSPAYQPQESSPSSSPVPLPVMSTSYDEDQLEGVEVSNFVTPASTMDEQDDHV